MEQVLSRQEASEAVQDYGWRFLLGVLRTSVPVGSLAQAIGLATDVVGLTSTTTTLPRYLGAGTRR